MHEKLMRFKVIKDDRVFDAFLDDRLSFLENFKMLVNISDYDIDGCMIYDPNKKIFLNNEIPIEEFNLNEYKMMYLF